MTGDVRISTGLQGHPKTRKLLRRLGPQGAWGLVCLFAWVAANRASGDLSGLSDEDIELAIDWHGEAGAFVRELADVGFLDGHEEHHRCIHDWKQHNPWASGADLRSAKARWNAVKRHHGEAEADRQVPEWVAARNADSNAGSKEADADSNAASTAPSTTAAMLDVEKRDAPSPSPSPSPLPSPLPFPSPLPSPPPPEEFRLGAAAPPAVRTRKAPSKPKSAEQEEPKTRATWQAYSAAFTEVHGVPPVSNAKVNKHLSLLLERIPAADAPGVAAFYVRSKNAFYVARQHSVEMLLKDAEKLHVEWRTGQQVTATQARLADRAQSNLNAFGPLLEEARARERRPTVFDPANYQDYPDGIPP